MKKKTTLWIAGIATTYFTVNGIVSFRLLKKAGITYGQFGRLVLDFGPAEAFDILFTTAELNSN